MDLTSSNPDKFEIAIMYKEADGTVAQKVIEGAELATIVGRSKAFQKDDKK